MKSILATILSFFLPGLGQIVLGETKKGIIFLVLAFILSYVIVTFLGTIGSVIYLVYVIYAAYDAYKLANV